MNEIFIATDKIFHHPDRLLAFSRQQEVLPITVEIHLTNVCNLKCHYCSFSMRHDKVSLNFDSITTIIEKLSLIGVRGITFSGGGEPTVSKYIYEAIKLAKSYGIDVGLITNGVKPCEELLELLSWIRFSLDASNRELYRRIKGVDLFATVRENIVRCVDLKHDKGWQTTIGVQLVVTEENYRDILPTLDLAENMCVDYFQFRPQEGGFYQDPKIITEVDVTRQTIKNLRHNKIHIVDTWYKWKEAKEVTCYTNCIGANFIGAVGADGNYYICCHHVGEEKASYGNMLTDSIEHIITNRAVIQKKFNYKKCPIACRGSVMNRRLNELGKIAHVNFI